jgi:hypothetical protein
MVTVTVLGAQNNTSATMHLKGKVLDSTNLPMAATNVKVFKGTSEPKAGTAAVKEGVTNNDGDFDLEVPPGDYYIEISAPDFNPFKQAIKATATMQPLAVTLTVKVAEFVIDVDSNNNEVGVDSNSSLTTDTLTGDALLDLPDNEEDLLAYLEELAAARGIIGGELEILTDGFRNSYLPNRNEIAEIRIVNTSFDAAGGGSGPRIEIVTRPGTGFWTGNVGFQFADESLNAAAPLTGRKPASQTRNFDGQLRGPIIPGRVTATINVQSSERDSEGNAIRAVWINGPVNEGLSRLTRSRTFRFGPQLTINRVHRLTSNLSYGDSKTDNGGVGGFTLPQRATDSKSHNWSIQMTETADLKATLRNEFRFQVRQNYSATVPLLDAVAINVTDAFNGGGAPNRSENTSRDFVFGNTTRWQASRNLTLTMSGEANLHKTHSDSRNNYLGTYQFASLHDYCVAEAQSRGEFIGTQCQITKAYIDEAELIDPDFVPVFCVQPGTGTESSNLACNTPGNGRAIPISGVATSFRITAGTPVIEVQQAEFAAYMQGEWRLAPRAQLSFGARYQAQQHLDDYNNIAPTLGLSYQLNTKQNWQTVVRIGGRMNYSTYSMGSWEQLLRSTGPNNQTNYELLNPTFPIPDTTALNVVTNPQTTAATLRIRADDYAAGYTIQPSLSVDQSLPKGHRLSFNFQMSRGVHQSRTRNTNAPYPGTQLPTAIFEELNYRNPFDLVDQNAHRAAARAAVDGMRPDSTRGNISMNESSGSSLTKNFSIQYRTSNKRILWQKVLIGGTVSWNMNWAEDNSGTPMNNWDLASEWGRASGDQRHRVSGSLNVEVPWRLRFSFTGLGWNSGRPYTITTGFDLNGDGSNNDRPAGLGRNSETGPSSFNVIGMTVTKTIPLPGGTRRPTPTNDYAEPQRGGGGFGGGGGGGGFGGGGSRGGGAGGRQIQLSVRVTNLFNSTVRTNVSGVLSSPLFGQITGGGSGRTMTVSIQTNLGQLF